MKTGLIGASAILAFLCAVDSGRAGDPLYTAAVLDDNPLLYWNFDEPSGDALELINGLPGATMVPAGAASRATSGVTAGGVGLGRAAAFDGTPGSRYQASDVVPGGGPGAGFITSQRWAAEFWVNLGGNGPTYISEMYSDCCSNDASMISGFLPGFEMFAGGRTGNAAPVPLSPGTWHHVVAAFYGNSSGFADNLREIYVDGVLALSDTTSNFSAGHGLNRFAIGNAATPNDNAAPLMVDEYAIYELPGGGLLNDQVFVEGIAAHYFTAIPEPSTAVLALVIGLVSLAAWKRRSK
jgi:hypothetical protein